MREFEFLDSKTEENEKGMPNIHKPRCEPKPPKPCLGVRFTEHEIARMNFAEIKSEEYMRTYGKGASPSMIDRSHYL